MSNLEIKECFEFEVWDDFVRQSPLGCPSLLSFWLEYHDINVRYYVVWHKNEIIAAYPLINNIELIQKRIFGYAGIILSKCVFEMAIHSRVKLVLNIIESLLKKINLMASESSLIFHPDFEDMRGVLWYNYNEPYKGQYKVNVSYTSILNFNENNSYNELSNNMHLPEEYNEVCSINDCDDVVVKSIFSIEDSPFQCSRNAIMNMLLLNKGEVIYCKNDKAKMCVVLYGNKSAQLIIDRTMLTYGDNIVSSIIFKAIELCLKKNMSKLDINCSSNYLNSTLASRFEYHIKPYYEAKLVN